MRSQRPRRARMPVRARLRTFVISPRLSNGMESPLLRRHRSRSSFRTSRPIGPRPWGRFARGRGVARRSVGSLSVPRGLFRAVGTRRRCWISVALNSRSPVRRDSPIYGATTRYITIVTRTPYIDDAMGCRRHVPRLAPPGGSPTHPQWVPRRIDRRYEPIGP